MKIELVHSDAQRWACFEVLRELRPTLTGEAYLPTLQRLGAEGFTLAALFDDDVRAVAGFRMMEMLATGRILYVDDLVTASAFRSRGYGTQLLTFLEAHALEQNAKFLELDSGLTRVDAHRFYRRHGLEEVALHFSKPVGNGPRWSKG